MERTSGKRRGRDRRRRSRSGLPPKTDRTYPTCPLCEQTIRDILAAIDYNDQPAHFDCIVKLIEKEEEMEPKDKVVYLGGGSFGIVQFRHGNLNKLFVRKRIQYEEKEKNPEWRKNEGKSC